MNYIKHIRQSLEGLIYTWGKANNVPVIFENIQTDTPITSHITTALMPVSSDIKTIATIKHTGLFQLTIYTPTNDSVINADQMTDDVMNLYRMGIYNGVAINKPTQRTQGHIVGDW
ncbi:MAG: hypothetical protein KGV56_03370 [Gammaproteobacteria bacterium]|nr:hypothetical protein [Gammaproteobacteria bacterium]